MVRRLLNISIKYLEQSQVSSQENSIKTTSVKQMSSFFPIIFSGIFLHHKNPTPTKSDNSLFNSGDMNLIQKTLWVVLGTQHPPLQLNSSGTRSLNIISIFSNDAKIIFLLP